MSSADGWLVEGESPKQAPGLCREKRRPKAGEGRAYTQNPTPAQVEAERAGGRFTQGLAAPEFGGFGGGRRAGNGRTLEAGVGRSARKARPALDRPRVEL